MCATLDANNFVVASPSTPVDSCTGYILVTQTEFADMQGVLQPLSIADGASVGVAIFTAWAIAWGFRLLGDIVTDADVGEAGDV